MTRSLVVHCADIGSVAKRKFGWARGEHVGGDFSFTGGQSIRDLVTSVVQDLNAGCSVALGFECPLFVPISEDPKDLTSARPGEGSSPWSAGAGSGALATGLTETVWILQHVRRELELPIQVFLDWCRFLHCVVGGGSFFFGIG